MPQFLEDGFHIETHSYKRRVIDSLDIATDEHKAILVLHFAGFSNRKISTLLRLSHTAVNNIVRRETEKLNLTKRVNKVSYRTKAKENNYEDCGDEDNGGCDSSLGGQTSERNDEWGVEKDEPIY